ncbi:Ubiquilin-4 [Entomortierella chlamydospora]|uniref:Ubiquilin-4 n=1 Tax=Entomortierella chlamydospora TaxID=101097 RepID=A0A9P6N3H3_9FUNG|nr:Ubiquilin-4 [Entomortierella chlamydospora]KAG0023272.1 Ubiquilin-4 [Entomortierella chlamydospora]
MEESESNIPQQAIVLTIRPSTGSTFTTTISTESTVRQLKEKLATLELPATSIRLVYSGRVLKDEDQLSVYSIKEGHTIHMVKGASNRANEQAVQTVRPQSNNSASGPEGFDEQGLMATLLDNPAIRDMMANPEVVRRMMMANPQTREVMENNPEVAQMLNDPSFLRQSLDMARNPKLMKQALRNNDRALSNLEMIPGGFNHLRRMYHSVQEPMEASRSAPEPSTDDLNAQFAARLNADTRPHAGELNTTPLPNPWAPPRQNNTSRPSPMFPGMPGASRNSSGGMSAFNLFANPFAGLETPSTGATGQPGSTQTPPNPFSAMMNQRMGGLGGGPQANPFGLQGMGEGFPPMGNNPEMFQQMMQFQQMMRQMQQQQQQQPISQPPMTGLPSLTNIFRGVPPLADSTNSSNTSSTNSGTATNTTDSTGNSTATATSAASTQQLEERFESQLASLRDMGFSDNSRNVRALLASGGDVHSAIEFLLRM